MVLTMNLLCVNFMSTILRSTVSIKDAHRSVCGKRVKRTKVSAGHYLPLVTFHSHWHVFNQLNSVFLKAASMSITSVLYLKDEISIATAGAVDRLVIILR